MFANVCVAEVNKGGIFNDYWSNRRWHDNGVIDSEKGAGEGTIVGGINMKNHTRFQIVGAALGGLLFFAPAAMAQDLGNGIQLVQYYAPDNGQAAKAAGEDRGAAAKAAGERRGEDAKYQGTREGEEAKEAGIRHSEEAKAYDDHRLVDAHRFHHHHHDHKPAVLADHPY